jgi:hypothetical protein
MYASASNCVSLGLLTFQRIALRSPNCVISRCQVQVEAVEATGKCCRYNMLEFSAQRTLDIEAAYPSHCWAVASFGERPENQWTNTPSGTPPAGGRDKKGSSGTDVDPQGQTYSRELRARPHPARMGVR